MKSDDRYFAARCDHRHTLGGREHVAMVKVWIDRVRLCKLTFTMAA